MEISPRLDWSSSVASSSLHAAEAVFRGRPLANLQLTTSLRQLVEKVRSAFQEERVAPGQFWVHVHPQAAGTTNMRELAEATLIKTIGRTEMPLRLRRFQRLLTALSDAFTGAVPDHDQVIAAAIPPLKNAWNTHGLALLNGIRNATAADVLVQEARVVVVYPACGGAGAAHLPYNLVRIEGVAGDPRAALPEVVRLAWLVSTLNLDLPRYSENVRGDVAILAGLAMIPVVLAAAADRGLACCDEPSIALAVASWLDPGQNADAWTQILLQWWEVYQTMRPPFPAALSGLDQLLVC